MFRLRLLWILTKPPWPADEGGKRVVWDTLRALAALEVRIVLVAPIAPEIDPRPILEALGPFCTPVLVPARPRGRFAAALGAQLRGRPTTIVRHAVPAVRQAVARLVGEGAFDPAPFDLAPFDLVPFDLVPFDLVPFDLVQCEQVQSLWAAKPARDAGLPVVLRAQNVESDLWRASARWWNRPLMALEARRLAAWEGDAVRGASAVLALTSEDASRLSVLGGGTSVEAIPAPFEGELPPAERALEGAPAVVLFGAGGWWPNRAGARWFVEEIWPAVEERCPQARLHLFGNLFGRFATARRASVVLHASPRESREAFAPGSIQVVPLHVASGVRIKILEAWARGAAVVATSIAARGLEAQDGRELHLADDAAAFARAIADLADPARAAAMVAAARERLRAVHAPSRVAERHLAVYTACLRRPHGVI